MNEQKVYHPEDIAATAGVSRRRFLGYAGGLAGLGLLATATGCTKDADKDAGIDLGSGDTGILNYAFALEQLEAAFYTQVVANPYIGITTPELALLTDIRDHEIVHREFFRRAIGAQAIQDLEVNFSAINFNDRTSVLTTARSFEDLGVSAYNGAGKLLQSDVYLGLAGKIVSVEARHAAYIRDLLAPGSFADDTIVDPTTRIDPARAPKDVLAIASAYLKSKLNAGNLPTA